MTKSIHRVTVEIRQIERLSDRVRMLELADMDDWELPPFTAGAHLNVHLPSGLVRSYSLCNDPAERKFYRIAVLREDEGRGGSRQVHELRQGERLLLSLPRNHLPLAPEGRVVMVAGGIGMTPFLSMVPVLERQGRPYELHLCARDSRADAFSALLAPMIRSGKLVRHYSGTGARLDIQALIAGIGTEDHVYLCGPERMISEAQSLGAGLGERLHMERFGPAGVGAEKAYVVKLARSGGNIPVTTGQTMLDALRAAGVDIPASCEAGVCLDCRTRFLEGSPDHRDIAMPVADRTSHLTPCVSGCLGDSITLDL
ncbi:PDR/VanB family oxidoreductase [Chelativorans alearense]|uniref:PDR/VanB family oxidoreductase n=1 Tax=Chelativorans alearense TaxID=2681495 RepID=UPI0013D11F37|nr:PDR/VanB family oxidoreductase [Chelativorans alearense]